MRDALHGLDVRKVPPLSVFADGGAIARSSAAVITVCWMFAHSSFFAAFLTPCVSAQTWKQAVKPLSKKIAHQRAIIVAQLRK
jgi:hypothetical protein